MKIRTLIVDDEPLARQRIRMLLDGEPDIEVLGECVDGPQAIVTLERDSPDLLFLDVQMPGADGFEVLRALSPSKMPVVIFTTAFDQHAVRAFEAHALDYLLKPFKPARFAEAVARAREHLANRRAGQTAKGLLELIGQRAGSPVYLTRLAIRDADRTRFLKTADIDTIEAAGKYVVVHVGKETHLLREALATLETQLDPQQFLRISRAAIVNLNRIKELQPMFKGDHVVVLHNGRHLPMTRGLREVESALKFSRPAEG